MEYHKYLYDYIFQNEVAVWGGFLFDNWPRVRAVMPTYSDEHGVLRNL